MYIYIIENILQCILLPSLCPIHTTVAIYIFLLIFEHVI